MITPGPADVVHALYAADAAGDDPSVHATGELAHALRLDVMREDGETAVVAVDGEFKGAFRQRDGEWKAFASRLRGRATLVRIDGAWKVKDVPSGRLSRRRALSLIDRPVRDGDLEVELAVNEEPSREIYVVVMLNHGSQPLAIKRLRLVFSVFGRLPMRLVIPLSEEKIVQPGESWSSGARGARRSRIRRRERAALLGRPLLECVRRLGDSRGNRHAARGSLLALPEAELALRR